MGRAGIGAPGAATQEGMPELTIVFEHFQHHIAVVTNEACENDGASAATSEAIAVCNVAVVGKLASATTLGARAGIKGGCGGCGGHGFKQRRGSRPDEPNIRHDGAVPSSSAPYVHISLQISVPVVDAELFAVPNAHGALEFAIPQPFLTIAMFLDTEALNRGLN